MSSACARIALSLSLNSPGSGSTPSYCLAIIEAIAPHQSPIVANRIACGERSLSMIARQYDGVLPEPGEFSDNDKAILAQADDMIGLSRTAMATQQIHQALNAVWAVVAEANRYFAGEAPWALAKTNPPRQRTVLYVTARSGSPDRDPGAAGDADIFREVAGQSGHPRGRARFRDAGRRDPHRGRHEIAGAGRNLPALYRTYRGLNGWKTMLVDSHCHLDFPDFADDLDAIVARARTAGVGRIVTISTRVRRLSGLLEYRPRASPNVYCSVGTHPHHADEEDGIATDELIELTKHPKVVALARPGWTISMSTVRAKRRSAGFAPTSPQARANRSAAGHPHPRCRRAHAAAFLRGE